MVVYYQIAGQKVGSHMLSIGVLSTLFLGSWSMMGGSKKPAAGQAPPMNASSKDEENFIQYVDTLHVEKERFGSWSIAAAFVAMDG
ncbi:hypothetical protein B0A50_02338 [Salinomyces thailandicus]|uniref:Uncharacterized protein n=1 Tax=Salinomyces thailandicus TaxID=706561 RepID=A0A4U0U884_9PEZI|nr:hypothetical protein B0A50_02338 [Salinomyces thailandica]